MPHPLVDQLRFSRSEWTRALRGISEEDGLRRLEPMNSIGWIVGHLAWQEQRYWLTRAQGTTPIPILNATVASGGPATTPALGEMLEAWRSVTEAADPWLDTLTTRDLESEVPGTGPARRIGDLVQRVTYHYWFHIGEILAIRQMLGHRRLPQFVGDIDGRAPYRPEGPPGRG
ncbi:MAG TPA: DinB family protein [Candidatus Limnocylindrales bacterium]|nr:DinB family protein [Candidatus Limnocylindrales bacterium]